MASPLNLVLVRHGMSEHNLARIRSINGDDSDWNTPFSQRHTSQYRLTDIGIEQAKTCGNYIKKNITGNFDRYFTSEYIRTIETAFYLDLPGAKWEMDFIIRERDKGVLSGITELEKENILKHYPRKERDEFFWEPPGGESMANLCIRVDHFLDFLNRECIGENIILVTHGTIMEAFRMRLEKIDFSDYDILKNEPIKNCQILWYTQRNPFNLELTLNKRLGWMRSICPYDESYTKDWKEIKRKKYNNSQLLEKFQYIQRYVNNTETERKRICSGKNGCEYK